MNDIPYDLKNYGAARLGKLTKNELKELCDKRSLNSNSNKSDLVNSLLEWKINTGNSDQSKSKNSLPYNLKNYGTIRLSKLTKNKLKELCDKRSLNTNGNKSDLVDRLLEWKIDANNSDDSKSEDTLPYDLKNYGTIRLAKLTKNELKELCDKRSLNTNGNKSDLIDSLLQWKINTENSDDSKQESDNNVPRKPTSQPSPGKSQKSSGSYKVQPHSNKSKNTVEHLEFSSSNQHHTQVKQRKFGMNMYSDCPCINKNSKNEEKKIPHKLGKAYVKAHVIFHQNDGSVVFGVTPTCKSCNSAASGGHVEFWKNVDIVPIFYFNNDRIEMDGKLIHNGLSVTRVHEVTYDKNDCNTIISGNNGVSVEHDFKVDLPDKWGLIYAIAVYMIYKMKPDDKKGKEILLSEFESIGKDGKKLKICEKDMLRNISP